MLGWAREQGVFPEPGGTLAQTRSFMEALQLYCHVVNELEELEMERKS